MNPQSTQAKPVEAFNHHVWPTLLLTTPAVYLAFLLLPPQESQIICLAALLVLLSLPWLPGIFAAGSPDLLSPPALFSFVVFLGHILPIRNVAEGTGTFNRFWPYSYASVETALAGGLMIAFMGVAGFNLGYLLPPAVTFSPATTDVTWNPRKLRLLGILYSVAGLGLFAVAVTAVGGFEALIVGLADRTRAFAGLGYLFAGILLLPLFGLLWWIYLLQNKRPINGFFVIYAITSLAVSGLLGSRASVFLIILAGVVVYHHIYRRIPAGLIASFVVLGLASLTAFGLFFREYLVLGELTSVNQEASLTSRLTEAIEGPLEGEFMQIHNLSIIYDIVPGIIPFQNGRSYLWLLTAPIPSSIWPQKLEEAYLPSAGVYTTALWPDQWYMRGTTMPPGLMGEFYMNFGFLGAFMGMGLFGNLFRCAVVWLKARHADPFAALIYSLLVAMIPHYIRGDFGAVTVVFITYALPITVAMHFVLERSSDRPDCTFTPLPSGGSLATI